MRIRAAGLGQRLPGQPLVVFESGAASPLETWHSVITKVAGFAPVLAYDRSGVSGTPWDSLPPTPERVVARLNRLLATLKQPPPYLLVGHSWGGPLIRYFGGAAPDQVVGMVYVDPTDITQTPADELAVFEAIGSNAAGRDAFYRMMTEAVAKAPPALRSLGETTMQVMTSDLAARKLPAPPPVPTTVILAGKQFPLPQADLPFDTGKHAAAMQEFRVKRLQSWVRAPGEFIIAANSGHMVQLSEPDLVIEAIRRMYQLPQKRK